VVRVLLPDGRRPEAPVTVIEHGGRTEEKDQEDRDVEFCDLGILPVTVKVGSDGMCNQTTVENVPISYDNTYTLVVTYDALACTDPSRQYAQERLLLTIGWACSFRSPNESYWPPASKHGDKRG
jgi:hypothetical protein